MPFLVWHWNATAEAGHQYYFDLRPLSRDLSSQVYAIHIWHRDVCQEQMYLAAAVSGLFDCSFAAIGRDHAQIIGPKTRERF